MCSNFWKQIGRSVKSALLEPKRKPRLQRSLSSSSFHSAEDLDEKAQAVQYEPATGACYKELPIKTAFAIMLLWMSRLFVPWIAAWHKYDILFLVSPEQLESIRKNLYYLDLIVFCVKCAITLSISFIAGVLNMERSTYMGLLTLYTLCPVAGGYVYTVLRARQIDSSLYQYWVLYVDLMRWAIAVPTIFFPVQLTSIFYEKENMSRLAHYNWVGFFGFFEFLNAYFAFLHTPSECPTTEGTGVAVWIGAGFGLFILSLLTSLFFFFGRNLSKEMIKCFRSPDTEESGMYTRVKRTRSNVRTEIACYLCGFVSLIFAAYTFAVLQVYIKDEDFIEDKKLSANGSYFIGRAIGVLVMVALLTILRKWPITRLRILRPDVLTLGLPHIFLMMGLLVLFGGSRATQHKGDVIMGAVPDAHQSTVVFFNLLFKNRTVCVSSQHFQPTRILPFHHAVRTLKSPEGATIEIVVKPEPCSTPTIATHYQLMNFSKGEWVVLSITDGKMVPEDGAESKLKNYYTAPKVRRHMTDMTYSEQVAHVFVFITYIKAGERGEKKQLKQENSSNPQVEFFLHDLQLLKVKNPGKWYIRSAPVQPFRSNTTPWYEFSIDTSYSAYFLANYLYAPIIQTGDEVRPNWFKLFKVTQVATNNVNSHNLLLRLTLTIRTGLILVGMAAGGVYVGIIYMFWIEPLIGTTTRFAITWVILAMAQEGPKIDFIKVDWVVPSVLGYLQIMFTILHFIAALVLYPEYNPSTRPD